MSYIGELGSDKSVRDAHGYEGVVIAESLNGGICESVLGTTKAEGEHALLVAGNRHIQSVGILLITCKRIEEIVEVITYGYLELRSHNVGKDLTAAVDKNHNVRIVLQTIVKINDIAGGYDGQNAVNVRTTAHGNEECHTLHLEYDVCVRADTALGHRLREGADLLVSRHFYIHECAVGIVGLALRVVAEIAELLRADVAGNYILYLLGALGIFYLRRNFVEILIMNVCESRRIIQVCLKAEQSILLCRLSEIGLGAAYYR